jgi:UDP-N-acetylglucosamine acyltransferase
MPYMIADTACVDPGATIEDGAEIGPYCIVGPEVRVGRGTRLAAHVCLLGDVRLGEHNFLGPFASLGSGHEGGTLVVGDRNILQEGVAIRAGKGRDGGTILGHANRLGPHVVIEPGVRLGDANNLSAGVVLGPGTVVGSRAVLTPGVSTHARVTIGSDALVGGPSRVFHDVPPFLLCDGHPARVRGLNIVGLRRLGLSPTTIRGLQEVYRLLFRAKLGPDEARLDLDRHGFWTAEAASLIAAIRAQREGRHGRALDRGPGGDPSESLDTEDDGDDSFA